MTNKADSLGDRMKTYEAVSQTHLMKRTPVIIRLDGKAFHTFTKNIRSWDKNLGQYPFSSIMHDAMAFTTEMLVANVQGCVLGYTQSDEISLLLRDWDTIETQAWFDNKVQKMVSVSASIASTAFNYALSLHPSVPKPDSFKALAQMDSRAYNIPKEEVANYFIWRQQDASRNSVQMLGHHHFSQGQMHGKNNNQVQDMLMLQKGINWNDIPTWMKRGSCVARVPFVGSIVHDNEIPLFTQDRNYVERYLSTVQQVQESKDE